MVSIMRTSPTSDRPYGLPAMPTQMIATGGESPISATGTEWTLLHVMFSDIIFDHRFSLLYQFQY